MKRFYRPLIPGETIFSETIHFFNNDIEYRILNSLPSCRINSEKIQSFSSGLIILKERIKQERLSLQKYKDTYLETYPRVDSENPYELIQGLLNRCKSTMSTLFKSSILLTPKYRDNRHDIEHKREIWNECILFAKEYQLSMFTDEYPDYVKEFISAVVELIRMIQNTLEYCEQVLEEEKAISNDQVRAKEIYDAELEACFDCLSLLNCQLPKEDLLGKILSENKDSGYGLGYHNPKVSNGVMMAHAACVINQRAAMHGIAPIPEEVRLFNGDMDKINDVRYLLNNMAIIKEQQKTVSNILAAIYMEYADQSKRNVKLFVDYANSRLTESDQINPSSIYRPIRNWSGQTIKLFRPLFGEILKTRQENKAS